MNITLLVFITYSINMSQRKLQNIKYVVPVMIGDHCCERSDTDAVTHHMNLLSQEEP